MNFKSYIESLESDEVPAEPGLAPIPPGHLRLYHYVTARSHQPDDELVENVKRNGIDIRMARGHTYGEPNAVWASTNVANKNKIFAEFSVAWNDDRWVVGKPKSQSDLVRMQNANMDVTFNDSIKPDEIIAIHLPWHEVYHYIVSANKVRDVLDGKFDNLLKDPESKEARAIGYIKRHDRV